MKELPLVKVRADMGEVDRWAEFRRRTAHFAAKYSEADLFSGEVERPMRDVTPVEEEGGVDENLGRLRSLIRQIISRVFG